MHVNVLSVAYDSLQLDVGGLLAEGVFTPAEEEEEEELQGHTLVHCRRVSRRGNPHKLSLILVEL